MKKFKILNGFDKISDWTNLSNLSSLNNSNGMKLKYFEGWYFKHQVGDEILVLIPGICIKRKPLLQGFPLPLKKVKVDETIPTLSDREYAFIQIITKDNSYMVPYPMKECSISKDKQYIKISGNIFSPKGVKLDIKSGDISLKGILKYGELTPLRYPIMGPFNFAPFMECKHEVISMYHKIQGNVTCEGKNISFDNGIGYIEKDKGHSFPKTYVWLQCNQFKEEQCSIMISLARIPYLGCYFKGCICAIHYKGYEYRMATYLGVSILSWNENEICLKQGIYLLKIQIYRNVNSKNKSQGEKYSHKLYAPTLEGMSKQIQEEILCPVRVRLYEGFRLLFDLTSDKGNFEMVK